MSDEKREAAALLWAMTGWSPNEVTRCMSSFRAGYDAGAADACSKEPGESWCESAAAEGKAKLRAEKKCREVETILRKALPDTLIGSSSNDAMTRALAALAGGQ